MLDNNRCRDVTLAATGSMLDIANQAAEKLGQDGVDAEVINLGTIKPLDRDILIESAKKTGRMVVLEEGIIVGGLGSAVAAVLSEACPVPMRYIGMNDCFGQPGDAAELMEYYGMTAAATVAKAKELL